MMPLNRNAETDTTDDAVKQVHTDTTIPLTGRYTDTTMLLNRYTETP